MSLTGLAVEILEYSIFKGSVVHRLKFTDAVKNAMVNQPTLQYT